MTEIKVRAKRWAHGWELRIEEDAGVNLLACVAGGRSAHRRC
jgi:hypothetical protein